MKPPPTSPDRARSAFAAAVGALAGIESGRRFGLDCALVNGNVFLGVHRDGLFLRLPESMRNEFRARYAARAFEPVPARPQNEYMTVPERLLEAPGELRQWIGRALSHARTLPPREREERRPNAPPAGARRAGSDREPRRERRPAPATPKPAPTVIVRKRRTPEP
jgi:TfoX/Sxy family transcriptional regulator of competence genes